MQPKSPEAMGKNPAAAFPSAAKNLVLHEIGDSRLPRPLLQIPPEGLLLTPAFVDDTAVRLANVKGTWNERSKS
jgi:hypothetical protein